MPQVDLSWLNILSETALAVPAWQVGAIGALVAVIGLLAMRRARSIWLGGVLRIFVVLIAGAATLAYFQMAAGSKRDQERRLLEERNAELTARSLVPGTPFACLDASAGEAVETGCEKAVFARPETAAASVAYVTARLALVSDGLKFAGRGDPVFAEKLSGVRRALELDRYGIVAHILMTRDGCTPDDCADFGLMRDLAAIKANMMAQAYENYVARYATAWTAEEKPPASAPQAAPPPSPEPQGVPQASAPQAPAPVASKYDFPSAASIPRVSIMNAEPPRPANDAFGTDSPKEAAKAEPEKPAEPVKLPTPPRRKQNQASAPVAR